MQLIACRLCGLKWECGADAKECEEVCREEIALKAHYAKKYPVPPIKPMFG